MRHVLFYGNCQLFAILKTLCLSTAEYTTHYISCHTTEYNKLEFIDQIVKSDIIIMQHINDNYRNKEYLSTSFLINYIKKDTLTIFVDICYFRFYYVDLAYKKINNISLNSPIPYHYNWMIECVKKKKSVEQYIDEYVNNSALQTKEELEQIANASLAELKRRATIVQEKYSAPNVIVLTSHDYIKENYKKKLLFYSMNHPTHYVIQYICEEISKYLEIQMPIDYRIDALDNVKCIIYKCIQQVVEFDISKHVPSIRSLNKLNLESVIHQYYEEYSKIDIYSLI